MTIDERPNNDRNGNDRNGNDRNGNDRNGTPVALPWRRNDVADWFMEIPQPARQNGRPPKAKE
jgi:hypothetical protein